MFKNRQEAGQKLVQQLNNLAIKQSNTVVMAIPRGGVVVGKVITQSLACPLGILVVKKIGAPGNPELALGAMGPEGTVAWNKEMMEQTGVTPKDLSSEMETAKSKLESYGLKFSGKRLDLKGKNVILTDDGIATGATIEVAITWLKKQSPANIILAVPVAPPEVADKFRNLVDKLVILEEPGSFQAVGQFYEEFPQVSDEEVLQILGGK